MKKTKKIFIATTLLLSVMAGVVSSKNEVGALPNDLVVDGSFEQLRSNDISNYPGGYDTMQTGSWYSLNGGQISYVGYNESERSVVLPSNSDNTWLGQVVDVLPNTTYVFSAWVKTSLADGNAILQVRDASNGDSIAGIDEVWTGGTSWKNPTITFNSGNRNQVLLRVLKWTDDLQGATFQTKVYIDDVKLFTSGDYQEYKDNQAGLITLENLVGNSDLVSLTDSQIKSNDGWPLGWNPGDYYSNDSDDNPTVIGAGYGENTNGFVLPANNGNVWIRTIANVKTNTDYIFRVRVQHSDPQAGTTVSVEGPNDDGTTAKLAQTWPGGTSWSEVELKFNSGSYDKVILNVYKYGSFDGSESEQATYYGTVNVSHFRLYDAKQYEDYQEQLKQLDQEQQASQYTEVWRDDFNTLDMDTWTYQLGHKRGIEPQDYVSSQDNVFIEDGNLVLRATNKDEYRVHYLSDGSDIVKKYDSGSIATFGKKEFLYGKIEVRAKLPKGAGAFPAIWTLGNDFTLDGLAADDQGVGWPMCGEIDIMELIGYNPEVSGTSDSTVHGTIHNGLTSNGDKAQTNTYKLPDGQTFNDDFHTFSIVWNPDTIQWYVDDNLYSTVYITDLDYFQKPHYLLLNLAAGGVWPGFPNEDTEFPMDFVIDYISYSQNESQKEAADRYYQTCPAIEGVQDITISSEDELSSLLTNVTAKDCNGNKLDVYCSINDGYKLMWNGKTRTSEIDFNQEGTYEIIYSTVGETNIYTRKIATLHVVN